MQQIPLPGMHDKQKTITNVASVPQRSPFRYPGGKTWLIPQIRTWLSSLAERPSELIEPFAGGAVVGLTAAFENLANHVTLVELDDQVASVWETVVNSDYGYWLADEISSFDLNIESVSKLLAKSDLLPHEQALRTIIKNRVNRGGILAIGAGQIKQGEHGRGIQSRWYPTTLRKRILDIMTIRDKLTFIRADGFDVIKQFQHRRDAVFFVDPPYTASSKKPGSRLYDYSTVDHEALFALLDSVVGDFVLTYDDSEYIRNITNDYHFSVASIPMKNTHHARQTELLISRNLDWFTLA